jgi:hypothetical protein
VVQPTRGGGKAPRNGRATAGQQQQYVAAAATAGQGSGGGWGGAGHAGDGMAVEDLVLEPEGVRYAPPSGRHALPPEAAMGVPSLGGVACRTGGASGSAGTVSIRRSSSLSTTMPSCSLPSEGSSRASTVAPAPASGALVHSRGSVSGGGGAGGGGWGGGGVLPRGLGSGVVPLAGSSGAAALAPVYSVPMLTGAASGGSSLGHGLVLSQGGMGLSPGSRELDERPSTQRRGPMAAAGAAPSSCVSALSGGVGGGGVGGADAGQKPAPVPPPAQASLHRGGSGHSSTPASPPSQGRASLMQVRPVPPPGGRLAPLLGGPCLASGSGVGAQLLPSSPTLPSRPLGALHSAEGPRSPGGTSLGRQGSVPLAWA